MFRQRSQPAPLPGWDQPNNVVRPSGRHPTVVPSHAGPPLRTYRPGPPQDFTPPQVSQHHPSPSPSQNFQAQPANPQFPHMYQCTHTGAPSLAEVRSRPQPQGDQQQGQPSFHPSRQAQPSFHPSRQQQQMSAHPQNHPSAHPSRLQPLSIHASRQPQPHPQGFNEVEIAPRASEAGRASQATRHIQPSGSVHRERVATDLGQFVGANGGGYGVEQGGNGGEQGGYGGNGGGSGRGGPKRRLVEVRKKGSGTSRFERR